MTQQDDIVKKLSHYSSPEISDALDALGIHGHLSSIKPIGQSQKLIGSAFTVQYKPYDEPPKQFMNAANYIDEVKPGNVVVICNDGRTSCSVWGSILTHFAHHHHIAGTVVHGAVRDVDLHEKYSYPVYACDVTPKTGKNRVRLVAVKEPLLIDGVTINQHDIIFADGTGTLVIPLQKASTILTMVQNIAQNEAKIIKAIDAGKTLKEARDLYHYEKPWEKDK